jgi:PDZ domain
MMKPAARHFFSRRVGAMFALTALTCLLAGCAATHDRKEKPALQRGWIGGEFRLAEKPNFFPTKGAIEAYPAPWSTNRSQKTGVLITALSSNTPARLAGLRAGDLILEINHAPVKKLQDFRRVIDHSEPGAGLPLKVFRDGETREYSVTVGCETYRTGGVFLVALPFILHGPDLWPNPDFSLVALGYKRDRSRPELGSVQETFRRNCDPKGYQAIEPNWRAWLVIMEVSTHKKILSQENVSPPMVLGRARLMKCPIEHSGVAVAFSFSGQIALPRRMDSPADSLLSKPLNR